MKLVEVSYLHPGPPNHTIKSWFWQLFWNFKFIHILGKEVCVSGSGIYKGSIFQPFLDLWKLIVVIGFSWSSCQPQVDWVGEEKSYCILYFFVFLRVRTYSVIFTDTLNSLATGFCLLQNSCKALDHPRLKRHRHVTVSLGYKIFFYPWWLISCKNFGFCSVIPLFLLLVGEQTGHPLLCSA